MRHVDGLAVQLEIHRDAFDPVLSVSLEAHARARNAVAFEVCGLQAYSFPAEEVVWHLCRHCVSLRHRFRMIWAADIIGFSETFQSTIDWNSVGRRYPFVLSTLSLLNCLALVPEPVLRSAGVSVAGAPPGIGEDYYGWPWTRARRWDSVGGRLQLLAQTLNPPEWWLRFNYGTGTGPAGAWRCRG